MLKNHLKMMSGLSLLAFSTLCPAAVFEKTLDNGLQIFVKPDHRAPVVVSQLWYNVGSSDEKLGTTGLSHALEHMLFKGTPRHPNGEFSRLIAAEGGNENAMTNQDYTVYYQVLSADRLHTAFELEADRMQQTILKPDEVMKEMAVIKEERHMRTDDNPQALLYEKFIATAQMASPYHHPIIGWPDDLDKITLSDIQDWYKRWYAPNNAKLVIVGDVDPEQVFRLAQQHFGKLKPSTLPARRQIQETNPLGERSISLSLPAKLPFLLMAYNVPSLKSTTSPNDAYALLLASVILDGGDSSRFHRELIRKARLMSSAGTSYSLYDKYDTLFLLQATPSTGHSIDEVKTALLKQIARLQQEPVTGDELKRAKTQLIADKTFSQDSLSDQANFLGQIVNLDLPWQETQTYTDRINALTAADIQRVARTYFNPNRLTTGVLIPENDVNKEGTR